MYFSRPSKLNVNIIFLTKRGSSFLPKNTLMQLHHIRGIKYLLILFIAGYLLFLFYTVHVPNSNFQEYFKYFVTRSHKFMPLFTWHHICHFGVQHQSSGSWTLFLFKHFLFLATWGKHSIVVKHKIESRAKQIKTKTYTQNQQNLMGTHTKCDWSFAI